MKPFIGFKLVITLVCLLSGILFAKEWTPIPSSSHRVQELEEAERKLPDPPTEQEIEVILEGNELAVKMAEVVDEGKCTFSQCAGLYAMGKKTAASLLPKAKEICARADELNSTYQQKKYNGVGGVLEMERKESEGFIVAELRHAEEDCKNLIMLLEDLLLFRTVIYEMMRNSPLEKDLLIRARERAKKKIIDSQHSTGADKKREIQNQWLKKHGL
jgi:hypothetical protein